MSSCFNFRKGYDPNEVEAIAFIMPNEPLKTSDMPICANGYMFNTATGYYSILNMLICLGAIDTIGK